MLSAGGVCKPSKMFRMAYNRIQVNIMERRWPAMGGGDLSLHSSITSIGVSCMQRFKFLSRLWSIHSHWPGSEITLVVTIIYCTWPKFCLRNINCLSICFHNLYLYRFISITIFHQEYVNLMYVLTNGNFTCRCQVFLHKGIYCQL